MRGLVRAAYTIYRGSPLHPHLGAAIKRVLQVRNRFVARAPFVHDVGPFRMHIDLRQLIDTSIYTMGTWEATSIATIRRLLPAGGTAIDVGANIGFMTLHMADCVGAAGRVVSFEPTTWAYDRLVANLALNDMRQVSPERAGLSDREARHDEVLVPYSYPLVGDRPFMKDSIVVVRLDRYFEDHPIDRLDFIKCDTDGWEAHVLRGASATLRRFRPALLLEINPRGLVEQGESVRSLVSLLGDLGYGLHHEEDLAPFDDLEAVAERLARTGHDLDVVALHRDSEAAGRLVGQGRQSEA
ncbi:MAG: FkbM family methyltransferase [Deltaproteobacteria bacterium]|nr:FkbM family methyltransferase [Deltaproteobacteria bacterium]